MAEVHVTDGGRVTSHVGDTLVVRLPENAATGYVWSVASLGSGLLLEEDRGSPAGRLAPGALGEHVVRVHAEQPGTWHIDLQLARGWEAAPAEERRITVDVV